MSYILKDIDTIVKKHFHIDNGGHTIAVDKHGNVYFDTGFFGYSETTIKLETLRKKGSSMFMVFSLLQHLKRAQSELVRLKEPADDLRPDELYTGQCGEVYKIVISKYGDVTLVEGDGDVILFLRGAGRSGSQERFIPFLIEALTEAKGKLLALAEAKRKQKAVEALAASGGSAAEIAALFTAKRDQESVEGDFMAPFTPIHGLGWMVQQGSRYGHIRPGKVRFYWAVSDTPDFLWEGKSWTEVKGTNVQVAMRECLLALAASETVPVFHPLKTAVPSKKAPKTLKTPALTPAFRQVGERGVHSANPGWWQTEHWNGVWGLVKSYNPTARTPFYWGLSTDPQRDIDLDGYTFSEHVVWHRATSFEDAREACIRAVLGGPVYPIREPIQLGQFPTVNPDPKRFPIPWTSNEREVGEAHVQAADGTYVLRIDVRQPGICGDDIKAALARVNEYQYPYGPDGGKYPAGWKK